MRQWCHSTARMSKHPQRTPRQCTLRDFDGVRPKYTYQNAIAFWIDMDVTGTGRGPISSGSSSPAAAFGPNRPTKKNLKLIWLLAS